MIDEKLEKKMITVGKRLIKMVYTQPILKQWKNEGDIMWFTNSCIAFKLKGLGFTKSINLNHSIDYNKIEYPLSALKRVYEPYINKEGEQSYKVLLKPLLADLRAFKKVFGKDVNCFLKNMGTV